MKILVLYATTDGQTRKIARFCADGLFALGHTVELASAEEAEPLDLARFDRAILAGSVHLGHLQKSLVELARAHAGPLNHMPTLMLQVSLSAAGEDAEERADLDRIAKAFAQETGWTPGAVHHIAGAFTFTGYDFFRSLAMRYIAMQKGQAVDPHEDREYTDWAALSALLRDWAGQA